MRTRGQEDLPSPMLAFYACVVLAAKYLEAYGGLWAIDWIVELASRLIGDDVMYANAPWL